jgi:Fe-S-cluster containining protein
MNQHIGYRVVLLPGDAEKLTEGQQEWLVDRGHRKAIGLKQNEDGVHVCHALDGTIGGGAHCSIHDNKPQLCREFVPGNEQCLLARNRNNL